MDASAKMVAVGELPSGTITFLFSDIEGSTRLWADHGEAMAEALARHDEIIRSAAKQHDGHIFATGGDSFAIAFSRPGAALDFSVSAQRALQAERWPDPVELRVRMGLHVGEAEERDGNYFGPSVNLAARIEAAGHGRQVLVSAALAELSPGVDLLELGTFHLKDVVSGQRIFQLGRQPFPPLRTAATTRGNLPRRLGRLIGRDEILASVEAAMSNGSLTTLIGPGGIGKTRIALEAARRVWSDQADGAWLVELAPITDPRDVVRLVADVLRVKEVGDRSLAESVIGYLEAKRCVLLLDNCEHVIDGVSSLAQSLVQRCPDVTVLATSREGLGLRDEVLMAIPPLDEAVAAVELFEERASAADPSFELAPHREAVVEVCRRLDGMPLAIELAAARVRTLAPGDLAERLDDRLRLLTAGRRAPVERHRTLRATIEWSFDLLDQGEQLLFARLSTFAGWFDLAAAEEVATDEHLELLDVDELLGYLVDRSMVLAESGPFGRRFRLLETMRQFGTEQLMARGETDRVGRRHAEWCSAYVNQIGDMLTSEAEVQGVARLGEVWDNVRAAHAWACATEDVDLANELILPITMELYWRGRIELGDWLERTLEIPGAASHELHALMVSSAVGRYRWTADANAFDRVIETHGEADHPAVRWQRANLDYDWAAVLELSPAMATECEAHGLTMTANAVKFASAAALMYLGRVDDFSQAVARYLPEFEKTGSPTLIGLALYGMSLAARAQGNEAEAEAYLDRALSLERPPDTWSAIEMLDAMRQFDQGAHQEAYAVLASAIRDLRETENMWLSITVCRHFVTMMSRLDRPRETAHIMGFYQSAIDVGHSSPLTPEAQSYIESRMDNQLRSDLTRGSELSTLEALDYMLDVFENLQH